MESGYMEALEEAIWRTHRCKARHLGTVHVRHALSGKMIWEGNVEIFTVEGSTQAKECFAWKAREEENGAGTEYVTVLRTGMVKTPADAVRAYIVSQHTQ